MPFYQYTALDRNGNKVDGTIEARHAGEALQQLMSRGLSSPRILGERASPPAPGRAAPGVRPTPNPPISKAQSAPVQGVKINTLQSRPAQVHRSRKSSDRELFFLFAQISDQLRAGINPAQTFGELAKIYKQPKFRESLSMIADAAIEGRPIADAMALWPDLYPEHVVGLMRAGQEGGFLPEAAATVAEHAENAHKFKRFHWWVWVVVVNALLSIPIVFMWRQSILEYWDKVNAEGGMGPYSRLNGPFIVMWHLIIWPWGPMILAICALFWILRNWLSTRGTRTFRHNVGLMMPVLGGRARNESVTIFTWVLGKLAQGGVPPNRSWDMAVASVPNLGMQNRLKDAGQRMTESSRLSDVVFGSNLFPQEYAPAVATGELTGDIPGALQRLSQVSRTEYEAGTVKSKAFTGTLGCTALLIVSGIATIVVAYALYRDLPARAMSDQTVAPSASSSNPGTPDPLDTGP